MKHLNSTRLVRVNLTWLRTLKFLVRIICKTYLHVDYQGVENVPSEGACLVVSNHFSGLDPFLIGLPLDRPIHYVSKKELFRGSIASWFLYSLGTIRLDRDVMDLAAARIVIQLLRDGELVGIAPEGTRSRIGEIMEFKNGVTKLALRTRSPLVPVAVYGTAQLMPPGASFFKPGKVYIKFGQAFTLSESYGKNITPELLERHTMEIRQKVVELFEQIRYLPLL